MLFAGNPSPSADLILLNWRIIAVDLNTIAEGVAMMKEKIISVGSNTEIRKLANKQAKTIDLGGRTIAGKHDLEKAMIGREK